MTTEKPTLEPPEKLEYQTPKLEVHDGWKALTGTPQSVPIQFSEVDENGN
jgi:hypothetical protein